MICHSNDYEQAFASWLTENGVYHVAVDQARRAQLARSRIKTFDFLLYPADRTQFCAGDRIARSPAVLIAEVKGRRFKGKSLRGRPSLQCWVTREDVQGLLAWQQRFDEPSEPARAVFIFAYCFELPLVESDGREVYDYADRRYMFYAVSVDDYCRCMKTRSPRWQTVTLSAADFRRLAVDVRQLLTNQARPLCPNQTV
ncbi:MAG TPA: HYExAFE family protein [Anaerohalosphaeraceae bacterium]|jgi:hypothetical protein|nr:HYExAFE family protein [Anaerohalosphaeraceae bacterium]HRT50892.1 HYExAFE family protein [Anaerohalosphaeraceae bacterium]HRT86874.1 HYExAFE family protein [Anaerohalosphaeraceae bacterium]